MQTDESSSPNDIQFSSNTSNYTNLNHVLAPAPGVPLTELKQMNHLPAAMENHIGHDPGTIMALQGNGENQNDTGMITSPEESSFVTIANASMSVESTPQSAAGTAVTETTYSTATLPTVIQSSGEETTTVMIPPNLPEGCSLLIGEDNAQYVTVPQDGQTYAIPISEFQAMQQGRPLTFQGMDSQTIVIQAPTSLNPQNSQPFTDVNYEQPDTQQLAENVSESHMVKAISSANIPNSIKWGMSAGPQDHMRPSITKAVPNPTERKFKPIKVDNWGIFLLNRLQSYFQKKEFCDLTIRFPSRNAQIKVHRLMVNACTDFFLQLEQEAKESQTHEPNIIDMPPNFTPETVAPIIKFMYTGRLEFKQGSFEKLRETAANLQMFVLTKLMDAQLNSPIVNQDDLAVMKNGNKRKRKRNSVGSQDDDPVKQMKKIKKIEKKYVTEQEKKNRQSKIIAMNSQVKTEPGMLPGKKLPIWKKREFNVPTSDLSTRQLSRDIDSHSSSSKATNNATDIPTCNDLSPKGAKGADESNGQDLASANASGMEDQQQKDINGINSSVTATTIKKLAASQASIKEESISVTHSTSSPTKAYGKEQPKGIPKKIRDINEDLTFEKIRRTGTRKVIIPSVDGTDKDKDISSSKNEGIDEDTKEFIEEQKKRLLQTDATNEDYEDDDYYDNDAELGYDDYNEATEEQLNVEDQDTSNQESDTTTLAASPARPILKSTADNASPIIQAAPRKSVRFSLRPGAIPVPKGIDSNEAVTPTKSPIKSPSSKSNSTKSSVVKVSPKVSYKGERPKRGEISTENSKVAILGEKDNLDETVDEFARAVEEEQELEDRKAKEKNSSLAAVNSNAFEVESGNEKIIRKSPNRASTNEINISKKDGRKQLPNQQTKGDINNKSSSKVDQKTDMVSEILRKFPNILKENKQVKIKVMAKDGDGKSRMQIITLKSQGAVNSATLAATATRNLPKSDMDIEKKIMESNQKPQSPSLSKANDLNDSDLAEKPETMETPVAGNLLTGALGLRSIPKVKYTGKRGRPKKVQPGEIDPHADVRKEIEQRLQKAAGIGQTLVIESTGFNSLEAQPHLIRKDGSQIVALEEGTVAQRLTDPSSEAEALSHVASGIATSLGLAVNVSNDQSTNDDAINNTSNQVSNAGHESSPGPLADLEHYEGGQSQLSNSEVVHYQVIADTSSVNQADSSHTDSITPSVANKNHTKPNNSQTDRTNASKHEPKASKVKEMEMDWEDEEEEV